MLKSESFTLADNLLEIERQMRLLELWTEQSPTAEQLTSTEPFCIDSLSFPQWLQFVFLPRMKQILEQGTELPVASDIATMAEYYFAQNGIRAKALTAAIREFDALIA